MAGIDLVVCHGDETGEELLVEALRTITPDAIGLEIHQHHFDLSLDQRRVTRNAVVHDAAEAMRTTGLGLKAATITPPDAGDVGSPNRILREQIDGTVIIRTGRRIPGVQPIVPLVHPVVIVRMAVGDAYGAAEQRNGRHDADTEQAFRIERIDRGTCRATAEYAFRTAAEIGGRVYGGPKWTVSPIYEGMLKEEMDHAASRHPGVDYRPTLIDAAYAGLITDTHDRPLVIPALNRDGDCLSDLVLAMYGSIAGAESVLVALDDQLQPHIAMAEAPHGTAPALCGRNIANPIAMILACAAVLDHAHLRGHTEAHAAARRLRTATLDTVSAGTKTADLGGSATTTEFVDHVVRRLAST